MTLTPSLKTTSKLEHMFLTFEKLQPKEKEFLTQHSHWRIFKIFEEITNNKDRIASNNPIKFTSEEVSSVELFLNSLKKQPLSLSNLRKGSLTKHIEQKIEDVFSIRIPRKLTTTENSSIIYLPPKSVLIEELSDTYNAMLENPLYNYIRPLYIEKIDPTIAKILSQIADLPDTISRPNFDLGTYMKIKFSTFSDDEIFYTFNFLKEFQKILNKTEIQISPPTEAAMNVALRAAKLFTTWDILLKNNPDPEIQHAVRYLKAIQDALNLYIE